MGKVGILAAGTADIPVAEEARVTAEEMGCTVVWEYDVGVAGIHRLFPCLEKMTDVDAFVVAAGREGTLPAVVAGLVDAPVIGLPVSTGYGLVEAAWLPSILCCSPVPSSRWSMSMQALWLELMRQRSPYKRLMDKNSHKLFPEKYLYDQKIEEDERVYSSFY